MANSPAFRKFLKDVRDEKIITPVIATMLSNPTFKGFDVPVEDWTPRPYDGWFHPSTHATWNIRQLTYYLTDGAKVPQARPELLFVLAVTQGKFWHAFVQSLLLANGIMEKDEVPLVDEEHKRRGHTDGLLTNGELFEFKTASERVIKKLSTVEDLKEYKPEYYAQTQDYLDMAGAEKMRYFVMSLSAPFPMVEFVVHADPHFQSAQRAKYLQALMHADAGTLPQPCCAIKSPESKSCPVRSLCPYGARE
jgi:hypothetical protein